MKQYQLMSSQCPKCGARQIQQDEHMLIHVSCAKELFAQQAVLRPIETAPKDGTWIILFGPSGYTTTPMRCAVGRWYPEYRPLNPWQTHSNDAFTDDGRLPTHWMPLPEMPK